MYEVATTNIHRKRFFDVWLLDTIITWHMTTQREWFSYYKPFLRGFIFTVDDCPLNIVGIGTIKLKMYNNIIHTI